MSEKKPITNMSQDSGQEETSHRQSILTEKGLEQFQHNVVKYTQRIEKVWTLLDINIKSVEETPDEINALQLLKQDITRHAEQLEAECLSYMEFLNRQHSNASEEKMDDFSVKLKGYRLQIDAAVRKLRTRIQDKQDTQSTVSSRHSRSSSRSS